MFTDAVMDEFKEWRSRPLESSYYIVYVDGIYAKTRETGRVTKRIVYTVIGVSESGHKDVLGFYYIPVNPQSFGWLFLRPSRNDGYNVSEFWPPMD